MTTKEAHVEKLAKTLGVSKAEVREKQKLIQLIIAARKEKGLSQAELGKKVGVSQGRIAQIESGVSESPITFDVLVSVLNELGYQIKILPKRVDREKAKSG